MGFVKNIMWANCLHFLYLLVVSIRKILASFQPIQWATLDSSGIHSLRLCPSFWRCRACPTNIASDIITCTAAHTTCDLLCNSFWSGSHVWMPKGMLCFKECSVVISVSNMLKISEVPFTQNINNEPGWTTGLPLILWEMSSYGCANNWINKTYGITTKLNNMSEVINFSTKLGFIHNVFSNNCSTFRYKSIRSYSKPPKCFNLFSHLQGVNWQRKTQHWLIISMMWNKRV